MTGARGVDVPGGGVPGRRTRVWIGAALIALIGGLLWIDYACGMRACGAVVIIGLGLAGHLEFCRLSGLWRRAGDAGDRAAAPAAGPSGLLLATSVSCALYFLVLPWIEGEGRALDERWVLWGIVALFLGSSLAAIASGDADWGFSALARALTGVVLFGLLYSFLLRIYLVGGSTEALIRAGVFFLGVKGTDIAGYLAGSSFGRHKFLKISPGKSLEGYAAALVFAAAWWGWAGWQWPELFFEWSAGALFGIILCVTTALGDLTESLIKRHFRVKDSGALLPEFGGVLDLIDSFLFSAFVFWSFLPVA